MVQEAADVPIKCRVGRARNGDTYYAPAVIMDIVVAQEEGSSRINQNITLMAYVNDAMIDAYKIDPLHIRHPMPDTAWLLLPAWTFVVTASSISGFAIARRPNDNTSHPESFHLAGVLLTSDDLTAEGFHALEPGMTQAELFRRAIREEFAREMRQPPVPSFSALDARSQIYPPVARNVLGVHPVVGVLHAGTEQSCGAIAYIALIDGAKRIATVRRGPCLISQPPPYHARVIN